MLSMADHISRMTNSLHSSVQCTRATWLACLKKLMCGPLLTLLISTKLGISYARSTPRCVVPISSKDLAELKFDVDDV